MNARLLKIVYAAMIAALSVTWLSAPAHAQSGSLSGSFYEFGPTAPWFETLANAQAGIASVSPTGTFTASASQLSSGYNASDNTAIKTWLGSDSSSYVGANDIIDTDVVTFSGYITGSGNQTFSLSSDDGGFMLINGVTVISNGGDHGESTQTGTYDFTSSTPVPVEFIYYNNTYNYNSSTGLGSGTSNFQVGLDGDHISPTITPEPSELVALAIGAGALCVLMMFGRKRQSLAGFGI